MQTVEIGINQDLKRQRITVDSEIFARFLFSRKTLKDILVTLKNPRLRQDLPISINERVILPFREGFIFTKFRENKVLAKISEFTVLPLRAVPYCMEQHIKMNFLGCVHFFITHMRTGNSVM